MIALALSAGLAGIVRAEGGPLPGLTGELLSTGHALRLVAVSWAAALPTAIAWTSLALILSARTRNSVIGIGVPAVLGILLQLAWMVDGPPAPRELLPSAALDTWHGLFETPAHAGPLLASVAVAAGLDRARDARASCRDPPPRRGGRMRRGRAPLMRAALLALVIGALLVSLTGCASTGSHRRAPERLGGPDLRTAIPLEADPRR